MSSKTVAATPSHNYPGIKEYHAGLLLVSQQEKLLSHIIERMYEDCDSLPTKCERERQKEFIDVMAKTFLGPEKKELIIEMGRCIKEHEYLTSTPGIFVSQQPSDSKKPSKIPNEPFSEEGFVPGEQDKTDATPKEPENKAREGGETPEGPEKEKKPTLPRRKSKQKIPTQTIVHDLEPDQQYCPCCKKRMHAIPPHTKIIVRSLNFVCEKHIIARNRCLTCETTFRAPCPADKEETICDFEKKTVALLIYFRYGSGLPSYRSQEVTSNLGCRVPASTQWDVFKEAYDRLSGFFDFLFDFCKTSHKMHADDTRARIIKGARRLVLLPLPSLPRKTPDEERTGVHTTGIIAHFPQGVICLYRTGLHHCGEVLQKIYEGRTDPTPIIVMGDGSTCNLSRLKHMPGLTIIEVFCNSHAVRKFKEFIPLPGDRTQSEDKLTPEKKLFQAHAEEILTSYDAIYKLDGKLKKAGVSPVERTAAHNKESLPHMESIKKKMETDFVTKKVEPNSELGKAYNYFLNHYDGLSLFCHKDDVPLCNNAAERMLKWSIRHRKNSNFYRTQTGADVGDTFMSFLFTAKSNGLNPVEYITALLDHPQEVKNNPKDFLPWNFLETLAKLNSPPQTPVQPQVV